MKKLMLLLVDPEERGRDGEGQLGDCEDEAELRLRWSQYLRLYKALQILGFRVRGREYRETGISFSAKDQESGKFYAEGCNWEASFHGKILEIDEIGIRQVEGNAETIQAIAQRALDKLSPEERAAIVALGGFRDSREGVFDALSEQERELEHQARKKK